MRTNEHGDRVRDIGAPDDQCRDCLHSVEDCVCPVEESPGRQTFGEENLESCPGTKIPSGVGRSSLSDSNLSLAENDHEELEEEKSEWSLDKIESLSQWYDERQFNSEPET